MDFRGPRRQRRLQVELNVTSFVDIIFNLLVFFILSTSFTTGANSNGLVVELPAATTTDQAIAERDLVVALTRDGQTVVRGRSIGLDELGPLLDAWRVQSPAGLVIVQADGDVPHSRVVEAMDRVKARGVSRVVIATRGQ